MGVPSLKIPDVFEADCENCEGLCCAILDIYRVEGRYAEASPAGTICSNLKVSPNGDVPKWRCVIHDRLAEAGWKGCADFDCKGAGQELTRFLREMAESGKLSQQMATGIFGFLQYITRMIDKFEEIGGKWLSPILKISIQKVLDELSIEARSDQSYVINHEVWQDKVKIQLIKDDLWGRLMSLQMESQVSK